jgi:hypothetical protein
MFTGIVSLGQQMTYRCYIYCPTTQARIYGNSATGAAMGGRLYASLDVKNPGADSTGVFDGLSYQYDWEVGIEIAGAAGAFTGVTLYSASKLNVKNPLPASLGTAGQVLTVNSGATGVEWASPSGGGGSYSAGDGISIGGDEISAVLGNSSGGMAFDNEGIAIDWSYVESSSDGTLEAVSDGYGNTSGIKVANPVPDTTGATAGNVLTIGQNGPEWAAPSGGGVYLAAANDMASPDQALYSDVLAAYNAGKMIYAAYHDSNNNNALFPMAPLQKYDPTNGVFTFTSVEVDDQNSGDVHFHTWWLTTSGWTDYSTTK